MRTIPAQYPAHLDLDSPRKVANWRPLVHWLLAIPQLLVSGALRTLRHILQLIGFFAILFTGAFPKGLFDVVVMCLRYEWRVTTYVLWMREGYPPFSFTPSAEDDGIDPASLWVLPPEHLTRWMPLVKWFLAIPHYIVLFFLYLGGVFVGLA